RDILVYRIAGPLFFGATHSVAAVLEREGHAPRAYVLDLAAVPIADTTAALSLKSFIDSARRKSVAVYIAGANASVRRTLEHDGLTEPFVTYRPNVKTALGEIGQ
ncbi:MAG: sodium-independent anion transporter, partial [Candidatus Competibacteraceae bacterium]|nr:sodium-independent anion transporter [Candidatus Competibacteraceae bacterium]